MVMVRDRKMADFQTPLRLVTLILSYIIFSHVLQVEFDSRDVLLGSQFLSYTLYSLQGTLNPILYSMTAKEWRINVSHMVRTTFRKKKEHENILTLTLCEQRTDTNV